MTQEKTSASAEATSSAAARAALTEKFIDILIPGYEAEFDPDEAEQAGAFAEEALNAEDAAESSVDAVDFSALASGAKEEA